jgi:hypothetical protein
MTFKLPLSGRFAILAQGEPIVLVLTGRIDPVGWVTFFDLITAQGVVGR